MQGANEDFAGANDDMSNAAIGKAGPSNRSLFVVGGLAPAALHQAVGVGSKKGRAAGVASDFFQVRVPQIQAEAACQRKGAIRIESHRQANASCL